LELSPSVAVHTEEVAFLRLTWRSFCTLTEAKVTFEAFFTGTTFGFVTTGNDETLTTILAIVGIALGCTVGLAGTSTAAFARSACSTATTAAVGTTYLTGTIRGTFHDTLATSITVVSGTALTTGTATAVTTTLFSSAVW
tara:strand:- start:242 stop:661 length:420 start_codon:yes stop_codon:yes gene_type:complete